MVQFITISGLSDYRASLKLMEERVDALISNSSPEVVYLLEYKDIYTGGSSSDAKELFDTQGIEVIYTGRGGKFTFHGPGQRIIYPLLNLSSASRQKDLKLYISMLEEWLINSLSRLGINACTISDKVGIWVTEDGIQTKIASIGVRVKKWVTYHGIAVNISTDLSKFLGIAPCGLVNNPITSITKLGINIEMKQFDEILKSEFIKIF